MNQRDCLGNTPLHLGTLCCCPMVTVCVCVCVCVCVWVCVGVGVGVCDEPACNICIFTCTCVYALVRIQHVCTQMLFYLSLS